MHPRDRRIRVLYLAPWVDFGGSDKGTIDWFRWLDRDRFAPSLITTQPSDNRRLNEIFPFADEVWALPDLMAGSQFPGFIFDFIRTRQVRVLHIMNSRLAYELLPDLGALPCPPRVVVQLHVEEPDRSGYVRYVTSRYGNLVDGFSVTSRHLAHAVEGYDVPRSKIHVIPTGVDARDEFNPQRVLPLDHSHEPGAFHILFAGRLADQKDPLLMLDAVRGVARHHRHVRVNIVGDGPLEGEVRSRIAKFGLGGSVRLHPPSSELARWLRSSDLLLMTSVFEGVPYVIYEALAMGVPVVAPALAGNVELMGETGGILIAARGDASAYTGAVDRMIEDPSLRRRLAEAGRERMLQSFSLRDMAAGHENLYERLLASAGIGIGADAPASPPVPAQLTFGDRPATGTPLVSVITPCFNHGRYLDRFLDALDAQDYPALELIIVDDGSTDAETVEVLRRLGEDGRARVIWHDRNRGPSVARNRAVAAATGRYILPVDADNLLVPGAVSALVAQLQAAGEQVGYIYPSVQYFGTRDYRVDPPAYNLFGLLHANFADTCSLLDRTIFDAGLRYAEDIELGHEDWDLALALGARGVIGEPSRGLVILYRKQGFTRSDQVEHLRLPFSGELPHRHPELFGTNDDVGALGPFQGPTMLIKTKWNPALSIILAHPVDLESESGRALLSGLKQQSCHDFELIAECPRVPPGVPCVVRRLPPDLCGDTGERVQDGSDLSRGRYVMVSSAPARLLGDRTTVEKLLRGFGTNPELDAIVLADLGAEGRYPFRLIERVPSGMEAHAIVWQRNFHDSIAPEVPLRSAGTVTDIADFIGETERWVQWRHFPDAGTTRATGRRPESQVLSLDASRNLGQSIARSTEQELRLGHAPAIPAAPRDCVPRWSRFPTWMPAETMCLVRHREVGGEGRIVTTEQMPPHRFQLEFTLGAIRRFSPPGTRRLLCRDGRFTTVPRGTPRELGETVLGYLEEAPLPLLAGIVRVKLPDGSETLVLASERDPLYEPAEPGAFLGFIETFPNEPVHVPGPSTILRPSLIRRVDRARRRHVYATAASEDELQDDATVSAELGVLLSRDGFDQIALSVDACGRLHTDRYSPPVASPDAARALRWAGAPARWRDIGYWSARPRAIGRRLWDVAGIVGTNLARGAGAADPSSESSCRRVLGYLQSTPGPDRIELFAAGHPVIGDQFVTHDPLEATDLGYEGVCSLGFISSRAPVTGALGSRGVAIPWASRFGLTTRPP